MNPTMSPKKRRLQFWHGIGRERPRIQDKFHIRPRIFWLQHKAKNESTSQLKY